MEPRTLARVCLSLGALLGAGLCASRARAQAIAPTIHVDCEELGEVGRAALEARSRADLASTPESEGAVVIVTCSASEALVAWGSPRGSPRARRFALSADEATNVDAIVDAIHGLSKETASPIPFPPTPDSATGDRELGVAPIRRALGAAPASSSARASAPTPGGLRVRLLGGVRGELWQGAVGGAIEAHVAASVAPTPGWALKATAGFGLGVASARGIEASTLRAVVGVDRALLAHTSVGLGAAARALFLEADSSTHPRSRTIATVGLVAAARYELRLGPVALSAGPDLDVLAQPLATDLGGAEVFRIPRFVAGLSIDVVTGLSR